MKGFDVRWATVLRSLVFFCIQSRLVIIMFISDCRNIRKSMDDN